MMDTETARKVFGRDRFAALAGIEILEAGKGYCRASLSIEDKHLNAANLVQGGAIFTLADLAFAVASNSHGQLALAINAHIYYLNAVSAGTLYATATEVEPPKKLGNYDVLITDQDENIIAKFTGMVYRKTQNILGNG